MPSREAEACFGRRARATYLEGWSVLAYPRAGVTAPRGGTEQSRLAKGPSDDLVW